MYKLELGLDFSNSQVVDFTGGYLTTILLYVTSIFASTRLRTAIQARDSETSLRKYDYAPARDQSRTLMGPVGKP